jgi:uncharacterized protein (DUF302 family)
MSGGQIDAERGLVRIASRYTVGETIGRLETVLREHGISVFARIDFSGDAQRSGLTLRPEELLVFGNPKAGTPLMVASPSVGIDLPFKVLAWEDADGRVWVAYNSPEYIVTRHGLDGAFARNLAALVPLITQATT